MLLFERVLSQIQEAIRGFLRRVHGVTLRDKARSFDIITFVITSSTLLAPSWCGVASRTIRLLLTAKCCESS